MNTRLTNEPIDGFSTFHALLLSAAKSPLSRLDDLRFVRPELDGAGEWIMAYNKPTSLRVPLSNVMEWSGKRIFTDIFKADPALRGLRLVSHRVSSPICRYFTLLATALASIQSPPNL
jgi:hypothetical protein